MTSFFPKQMICSSSVCVFLPVPLPSLPHVSLVILCIVGQHHVSNNNHKMSWGREEVKCSINIRAGEHILPDVGHHTQKLKKVYKMVAELLSALRSVEHCRAKTVVQKGNRPYWPCWPEIFCLAPVAQQNIPRQLVLVARSVVFSLQTNRSRDQMESSLLLLSDLDHRRSRQSR